MDNLNVDSLKISQIDVDQEKLKRFASMSKKKVSRVLSVIFTLVLLVVFLSYLLIFAFVLKPKEIREYLVYIGLIIFLLLLFLIVGSWFTTHNFALLVSKAILDEKVYKNYKPGDFSIRFDAFIAFKFWNLSQKKMNKFKKAERIKIVDWFIDYAK